MSLLGIQTQRDDAAVWAMVRTTRPGVLKLLNGNLNPALAREWRGLVGPQGLLVYRRVYAPGFDPADGPARTKQVLDDAEVLKPWGPVLVEEPWNEEAQNGEALAVHAEASVVFAREARGRGFVPVVLITSEGNPADEQDWLRLRRLRAARQPLAVVWGDGRVRAALRELKKLGAVRGCHGYTTRALGPHDPDHLLRYRREDALLPADCRLPVFLGETGDDYGIDGGPGHCGFRCGGGEDAIRSYAERLAGIRDELSKDPQVIGAAVFGCGMNDDWASFDVRDEVDLRAVFALGGRAPGPIPQAQEETVDTYDGWSMPKRRSTAHPENYSAAKRAKTIGVVVHSTAGVSTTLAKEFIGTINWFQNPDAGVSAHAVVGPTEVAACVPEDETAWHARENNADHLGLELAWPDTPAYAQQPHPAAYYDYAGELIARWAKKYGFPLRWVAAQGTPGLICHKESAAGVRDGKRDPTGLFDKDALLAAALWWEAELGGDTVPTTDVTKLRDQAWAIAEAFEKAGQPWTGQAIKAAIALSKGEK